MKKCTQDHQIMQYYRYQIVLGRFRKIDFLWFLTSGRCLGNALPSMSTLIKSLKDQFFMKKWYKNASNFLKSFQKYIVDTQIDPKESDFDSFRSIWSDFISIWAKKMLNLGHFCHFGSIFGHFLEIFRFEINRKF